MGQMAQPVLGRAPFRRNCPRNKGPRRAARGCDSMASETGANYGANATSLWTLRNFVLVLPNKTNKDYPPFVHWRMVQVWGGRSLLTRRPVIRPGRAAPPMSHRG